MARRTITLAILALATIGSGAESVDARAFPAAIQRTACVAFSTPPRLAAGQSFAAPIGRGMEVRLIAEREGVWRISVGPAGSRDDYLWVVSPPFQTAPHLLIGSGYNVPAMQSVRMSPRRLRFVTSAQEYEAVLALVERARRDADANITVADIERQGPGTLELRITGHGTAGDLDALSWIAVKGRACQPR